MNLWESREEGIRYSALAVVVFVIWFWRMYLSSLISDYQDEKPAQDKNPFDVLIKDLMSAFYNSHFTIGLCQLLSCFVPAAILNYDFVYFIAFIEYFYSLNLLITFLLTVYVKYVYLFQPEFVENMNGKRLLYTARMWKWIILILATVADQFFHSDVNSAIFKVLTRGGVYKSPICNRGIGTVLLTIATIIFGSYFLKSIFSLKNEDNPKAKDLKKHSKVFAVFLVLTPALFWIFLIALEDNLFATHAFALILHTIVFIAPMKYYISQDENLTIYAKYYHLYPPKVFPWQLPKGWREKNPHIILDIAGEK